MAAANAAIELAGRKAETAKKQAIEAAIAASERQAGVRLARAVKEAEEKVAAKWGAGVASAERAHEGKLGTAIARVETLEGEAKAAEVKHAAKLREARDEVEAMREALERAEALNLRTVRAGEAKATEAQRQELEAASNREMLDTLKVRAPRAHTCSPRTRARVWFSAAMHTDHGTVVIARIEPPSASTHAPTQLRRT
eukprot:1776852-Prymnesium_polylepis.2